MAQLENQAAVVADDVSAAVDTATPAEQQQPAQQIPAEDLDGSEFYEDDQPESQGEGDPVAGEGEDDIEEENLEPVQPPHSWKAEEKEAFAQLPRALQETVMRREAERERFVSQKAQEASQAEARVLTQARQELAEIHSRKAQEYQQLAAQLMPQPADPRLLYTGNPEDQLAYQRQDAAYRSAQAQQQDLLQRAQTEDQEAQRVAQENEREQTVQELRTLHSKFPDWFDEGTLKLKPETISRLQPIGEALGYPTELMAQANATDFQALDLAAQWKAKADKWDGLQKKRMEGVRAAKQLPRIAKPGAAGTGKPAADDPLKLLYPND